MIVMVFYFPSLEAHCYKINENDVDCGVTEFWKKGFVALQAAINAAIIEVSTKCSMRTNGQRRLMLKEALKVLSKKI